MVLLLWFAPIVEKIYFQPGGADKAGAAANSLFDLAVIEKQHKRLLTAQICQA